MRRFWNNLVDKDNEFIHAVSSWLLVAVTFGIWFWLTIWTDTDRVYLWSLILGLQTGYQNLLHFEIGLILCILDFLFNLVALEMSRRSFASWLSEPLEPEVEQRMKVAVVAAAMGHVPWCIEVVPSLALFLLGCAYIVIHFKGWQEALGLEED